MHTPTDITKRVQGVAVEARKLPPYAHERSALCQRKRNTPRLR
jgi:hypothetical protein